MKKTWKATFLITLEGASNPSMTKQVAKDKLFVPLQEMWILGHVNHVDIQEVEPMKVLSYLAHEDTKGKRESYYKTGFPKKKQNKKK